MAVNGCLNGDCPLFEQPTNASKCPRCREDTQRLDHAAPSVWGQGAGPTSFDRQSYVAVAPAHRQKAKGTHQKVTSVHDEVDFTRREIIEFNLAELAETLQCLYRLQLQEHEQAAAFRKFFYWVFAIGLIASFVFGVTYSPSGSG